MGAFGCCSSSFATLSRAAAKSAAARLRSLGLLGTSHNWAQRATTCETCPRMMLHNKVSYCGRPFLYQVNRDPAVDGCGCPTRDKARSPDEHCPIDWVHHPARKLPDGCTCKWCNPYE